MDDKCIMEDLLQLEKGATDLYMHGALESGTSNVHSAFNQALSDTITMQSDIYQKMSAKGWYPSQQADQQKISQVKQKYSNSSQG